MEIIISIGLDETGRFVATDGNGNVVFRSETVSDVIQYAAEECEAF